MSDIDYDIRLNAGYMAAEYWIYGRKIPDMAVKYGYMAAKYRIWPQNKDIWPQNTGYMVEYHIDTGSMTTSLAGYRIHGQISGRIPDTWSTIWPDTMPNIGSMCFDGSSLSAVGAHLARSSS